MTSLSSSARLELEHTNFLKILENELPSLEVAILEELAEVSVDILFVFSELELPEVPLLGSVDFCIYHSL
ncbi:hypothetical protein [Rickettsiella endosymbiont of Aleochara curtula]|uniref:hypothetical protein n=1 Tax=Rickettsiella endosymbiont of Aleochara curtula TaxID=3077936 RepID=UPI00313EBB88